MLKLTKLTAIATIALMGIACQNTGSPPTPTPQTVIVSPVQGSPPPIQPAVQPVQVQTDPAVLKALENINSNLTQLNQRQQAAPAAPVPAVQAPVAPAPAAPAQVPLQQTPSVPGQVAPAKPANQAGPQIGDLNPNTDAVNNGTCQGVNNSDGLYLQSGENRRCTTKLSQIPAGSQLVIDAIQFTFNGVEYKNTIKVFDLGNATTVDLMINNGGAKLGNVDVAKKRFCTIAKTATENNWALPNREPLPAWNMTLDATKNCA